jgi:hypothetical protein
MVSPSARQVHRATSWQMVESARRHCFCVSIRLRAFFASRHVRSSERYRDFPVDPDLLARPGSAPAFRRRAGCSIVEASDETRPAMLSIQLMALCSPLSGKAFDALVYPRHDLVDRITRLLF